MIRRDARSSICLGRLLATCSSRGASLKSRISFSDISSRIALRRAPRRLRLRGCDRALLVWMTRRWPSLLGLACVVQPGTILRWHRAGFRAYWGWQSRGRPARPRVSRELRAMIRRMCNTNPFRTTSSLRADMIFGRGRGGLQGSEFTWANRARGASRCADRRPRPREAHPRYDPQPVTAIT
jgi:hypothetical protein